MIHAKPHNNSVDSLVFNLRQRFEQVVKQVVEPKEALKANVVVNSRNDHPRRHVGVCLENRRSPWAAVVAPHAESFAHCAVSMKNESLVAEHARETPHLYVRKSAATPLPTALVGSAVVAQSADLCNTRAALERAKAVVRNGT